MTAAVSGPPAGGTSGGSDPARPVMPGWGLVLVLLTAGISGVSTFVNSYAAAGTNSDAFVTVRNLAVALFLVPGVWLTTRGIARRLRPVDWARLLAIGLIGGAIPFLLFFRGLELATMAGGAMTASFLYRTLFLWATTFAILFLGERLHLRTVLAAGLLLLGNLLLLAVSSAVWTDGSLYVMAATLLWAVEYTVSKRTLKDLPTGTVALGRMGFGAVFLLGYLAVTGGFVAVGRFTDPQWMWVGISALLLTGFVATWYAGLRRIDLGTATAVLVLGYPVTFLLAAVVRGASAPWASAVGAGVVTAGVLVAAGPKLLQEAGRAVAGRRPVRPPTVD